MCGRFVLEHRAGQLAEVYRLSSVPEFAPRYNIAPGQQVAVVRQHDGRDREMVFLHWGLVPSWAKDPAGGYKMINARSETAHQKPSFKQALHARRCIIPASGFYEWEKSGKDKLPHYIRRRDGDVMSLAGLWEQWKSPDGRELQSCSILTTVANSLIKGLHERMPVILPRDELALWLGRDTDDVGRLAELFHPFPSDQLEEYAVAKVVNSPLHDSSSCILPI